MIAVGSTSSSCLPHSEWFRSTCPMPPHTGTTSSSRSAAAVEAAAAAAITATRILLLLLTASLGQRMALAGAKSLRMPPARLRRAGASGRLEAGASERKHALLVRPAVLFCLAAARLGGAAAWFYRSTLLIAV